jgi:hypothetical protein
MAPDEDPPKPPEEWPERALEEPSLPGDAVIPPPPESAELQEHWNDLKEALNLPKLTDDKLREFVDDFVSGRIFTSAHLSNNEIGLLPMIFMPLSLGVFANVRPDTLDQIGCMWEYLHKASPRSINGKPMFISFSMLHVDDWERAKAAILKEEKRRESIEL